MNGRIYRAAFEDPIAADELVLAAMRRGTTQELPPHPAIIEALLRAAARCDGERRATIASATRTLYKTRRNASRNLADIFFHLFLVAPSSEEGRLSSPQKPSRPGGLQSVVPEHNSGTYSIVAMKHN